ERGLTDAAFRTELLEAAERATSTHTWDNVARRALEGYARLDDHRPRRRRPQRLKVAFVGPFAPAESGVATYNSRVVDALSRDGIELDLFAEATPIGEWRPDDDLMILPVEQLGM